MENEDTEAQEKQLKKTIDELTEKLNILQSTTSFQQEVQRQRFANMSFKEKYRRLGFYRMENSFEWNLLSNRVSSYITSQSFLITSYVVAMGNAIWPHRFTLIFPILISITGLVTSFQAYQGIKGAKEIIDKWSKKQELLFTTTCDDLINDFRDDRTIDRVNGKSSDKLHENSLKFSVYGPWIFFALWLILAGLTIFLHIWK